MFAGTAKIAMLRHTCDRSRILRIDLPRHLPRCSVLYSINKRSAAKLTTYSFLKRAWSVRNTNPEGWALTRGISREPTEQPDHRQSPGDITPLPLQRSPLGF